MSKPTHGFTKRGHAVHGKTGDHLPGATAYQRFNKKAALFITAHVGTMTCTWLFCLLALCSLPATLVAASVVSGSVFHWAGLYVASAGLIALVTWTAQSFVQLVLLPALMVGQNLQNAASDARSAKTFEDIEAVKHGMQVALDLLDTDTTGGLKTVLEHQAGTGAQVMALARVVADLRIAVNENFKALQPEPPPARRKRAP